MSRAAPPAPRAVIADDERLMREQLRTRCGSLARAEIVAEAKNGAEAVQLVEQHQLTLPSLDIRMPGNRRGRARSPAAPATIWAGCEHGLHHRLRRIRRRGLRAGAADYVLKPAERERLAHLPSACMAPRPRERGEWSGVGRHAAAAAELAHVNPGAAAKPEGIQATVGRASR